MEIPINYHRTTVAPSQPISLPSSPTHRLPTELWLQVFQWYITAAPTLDVHRYIGILVLVSRTWKQTIEGHPALWTIVDSRAPLAFNASALIRSKEMPLAIVWDPSLTHTFTKFLDFAQFASRFLRLVLPDAWRWKSVCITQREIGVDDILATLPPELIISPVPMLTALSWTRPIWLGYSLFVDMAVHRPHAFSFGDLMTLPVPGSWDADILRGLRSIKFQSDSRNEPLIRDVLKVIDQNPELETFELLQTTMPIVTGDYTVSVVLAPKLRSITLDAPPSRALLLLPRLQAPNLTSFIYTCDASEYSDNLSMVKDSASISLFIRTILNYLIISPGSTLCIDVLGDFEVVCRSTHPDGLISRVTLRRIPSRQPIQWINAAFEANLINPIPVRISLTASQGFFATPSCMEALSKLPHVDSIVVKNCHRLRSFGFLIEEQGEQIPFPELVHLTLEGTSLDDEKIASIMEQRCSVHSSGTRLTSIDVVQAHSPPATIERVSNPLPEGVGSYTMRLKSFTS